MRILNRNIEIRRKKSIVNFIHLIVCIQYTHYPYHLKTKKTISVNVFYEGSFKTLNSTNLYVILFHLINVLNIYNNSNKVVEITT